MSDYVYKPQGGDGGVCRYSRVYTPLNERQQNPARYSLSDSDVSTIIAAIRQLDFVRWAEAKMQADEATPSPPAFGVTTATAYSRPQPTCLLGSISERERDCQRHRDQYARKQPAAVDTLPQEIARRHAAYVAAGTHRTYDQIRSELFR